MERTIFPFTLDAVRHLRETAIIDPDGGAVSYNRLAVRVDQIAALLADQAIGHGELVAIVQNKSAAAFAAILAVLASGAAYLPLSPRWPRARLEQVLDDYGIETILIDRAACEVGAWPANRKSARIIGIDMAGDHAVVVCGGDTDLDRRSIHAAIDESLKRLGTDYIDLYQLHWPSRPANYFGRLHYRHDPKAEAVPILETLEALDELRRAGKIRAFGVSNETAWGGDGISPPRRAPRSAACGTLRRSRRHAWRSCRGVPPDKRRTVLYRTIVRALDRERWPGHIGFRRPVQSHRSRVLGFIGTIEGGRRGGADRAADLAGCHDAGTRARRR